MTRLSYLSIGAAHVHRIMEILPDTVTYLQGCVATNRNYYNSMHNIMADQGVIVVLVLDFSSFSLRAN